MCLQAKHGENDKSTPFCPYTDKISTSSLHINVQNNRHSCSPTRSSGHVRPREGTEICNFRAPSPLEALHWIFCFFSSIYVQFSKTSPLKSGESSEKSSGENRVKSCHVCGCHGFFGPEKCFCELFRWFFFAYFVPKIIIWVILPVLIVIAVVFLLNVC